MNPLVLDFDTVSRELRSIVARRRELMLFQGSLFAAMGLLLQKVLDGNLPSALKAIEQSAFFTHSVLVLVPTTIIALRIAKLHTGMTINGVFFSRAVQEIRDGVSRRSDPRRAARLNIIGVSSSLFWLTAFLASGEASLLALSLRQPPWLGACAGVIWFLSLGTIFLTLHLRAARFALRAIENCRVEPLTGEDREKHLADSREDANHDLISTMSFVGLMLFSSVECITGLGKIGAAQTDLAAVDVQKYGPVVYNVVLLVVCVTSLLMYLRLAVAVADFSRQLDPTDTPYRPFKLTDTMFGYWIVVFFFTVAVHLAAFPWFSANGRSPWIVDLAAAAAALALYPLRIMAAGRAAKRSMSG